MRCIAGTHLIVDGYVSDKLYFSQESVFSLFDSLVSTLQMTYLTTPVACEVPVSPELLDSEEDEGGTSFYAQITTSHLALHAWPLRRAFMFDVFSCRNFDANAALSILLDSLHVEEYHHQIITRTDPKEVNSVKNLH